MQLLRRTFEVLLGTSAIAAVCGVCLITAVKSAARSDCDAGNLLVSSSSSAARAASASLAVSVVSIALSIALLRFHSRSKSAWGLLGSIGKNWQSTYFTILSLQRAAMTALVIEYVIREPVLTCLFVSSRNQVLAASFLWNIATFWFGFIAILSDFDSGFTPAMRRSTCEPLCDPTQVNM